MNLGRKVESPKCDTAVPSSSSEEPKVVYPHVYFEKVEPLADKIGDEIKCSVTLKLTSLRKDKNGVNSEYDMLDATPVKVNSAGGKDFTGYNKKFFKKARGED